MDIKKTLLIIISSLILIGLASKIPVWFSIAQNYGGTLHGVTFYVLLAAGFAVPFTVFSDKMKSQEKLNLLNRSIIYLIIISGIFTTYSYILNRSQVSGDLSKALILGFVHLVVVGGVGYLISYFTLKSRFNK